MDITPRSNPLCNLARARGQRFAGFRTARALDAGSPACTSYLSIRTAARPHTLQAGATHLPTRPRWRKVTTQLAFLALHRQQFSTRRSQGRYVFTLHGTTVLQVPLKFSRTETGTLGTTVPRIPLGLVRPLCMHYARASKPLRLLYNCCHRFPLPKAAAYIPPPLLHARRASFRTLDTRIRYHAADLDAAPAARRKTTITHHRDPGPFEHAPLPATCRLTTVTQCRIHHRVLLL